MNRKLLFVLVIGGFLPLTLYAAFQFRDYFGRAAAIPANLVIDVRQDGRLMKKSWSAFAQGGEEPPPMFSSVTEEMKKLSPRYIRVDHIYDYYQVVKKENGNLRFDFTKLDLTVNDILQMGALPFFSLSYMPKEFTGTGSVIDAPLDWNMWRNLVRETILHYSGRKEKNLSNVYYEVWNEPELPQFGNWRIDGRKKDYRTLYYYAAAGAQDAASDSNTFYFGGPAVGSYYPNWIRNFVSFVIQNNLRFDFYSWHRYHKNPEQILSDIRNTRIQLKKFPEMKNIPLVISEWGIDSENTPINNSEAAAAFTIATISQIYPYINYAFHFEVKDGPPSDGGKWGLFTHERSPQNPLSPKPKYKAFEMLARLPDEELQITGQGTFVKAIGAKNRETVGVVVSNYDRRGKNTEFTPVTFQGLDPAAYELFYRYLTGETGKEEVTPTEGTVMKSFILKPDAVLAVNLTRLAAVATLVSGRTSDPADKSLALTGNDLYILQSPVFRLQPQGSIRFDIMPLWEKNDFSSIIILDIPFSVTPPVNQRLYLAKLNENGVNYLEFGVQNLGQNTVIRQPIDSWEKNSWHSVLLGWDVGRLRLQMDDGTEVSVNAELNLRNGQTLSIYPANMAIDNLSVTLGDNYRIFKSFNGSLE